MADGKPGRLDDELANEMLKALAHLITAHVETHIQKHVSASHRHRSESNLPAEAAAPIIWRRPGRNPLLVYRARANRPGAWLFEPERTGRANRARITRKFAERESGDDPTAQGNCSRFHIPPVVGRRNGQHPEGARNRGRKTNLNCKGNAKESRLRHRAGSFLARRIRRLCRGPTPFQYVTDIAMEASPSIC